MNLYRICLVGGRHKTGLTDPMSRYLFKLKNKNIQCFDLKVQMT